MIDVCEICSTAINHDDAWWFAPSLGTYAHAVCCEDEGVDPEPFEIHIP